MTHHRTDSKQDRSQPSVSEVRVAVSFSRSLGFTFGYLSALISTSGGCVIRQNTCKLTEEAVES